MKTWDTEPEKQSYYVIDGRFYAGKSGSDYSYEDALKEHEARIEPCLNCGRPATHEYGFICVSCLLLSNDL